MPDLGNYSSDTLVKETLRTIELRDLENSGNPYIKELQESYYSFDISQGTVTPFINTSTLSSGREEVKVRIFDQSLIINVDQKSNQCEQLVKDLKRNLQINGKKFNVESSLSMKELIQHIADQVFQKTDSDETQQIKKRQIELLAHYYSQRSLCAIKNSLQIKFNNKLLMFGSNADKETIELYYDETNQRFYSKIIVSEFYFVNAYDERIKLLGKMVSHSELTEEGFILKKFETDNLLFERLITDEEDGTFFDKLDPDFLKNKVFPLWEIEYRIATLKKNLKELPVVLQRNVDQLICIINNIKEDANNKIPLDLLNKRLKLIENDFNLNEKNTAAEKLEDLKKALPLWEVEYRIATLNENLKEFPVVLKRDADRLICEINNIKEDANNKISLDLLNYGLKLIENTCNLNKKNTSTEELEGLKKDYKFFIKEISELEPGLLEKIKIFFQNIMRLFSGESPIISNISSVKEISSQLFFKINKIDKESNISELTEPPQIIRSRL